MRGKFIEEKTSKTCHVSSSNQLTNLMTNIGMHDALMYMLREETSILRHMILEVWTSCRGLISELMSCKVSQSLGTMYHMLQKV